MRTLVLGLGNPLLRDDGVGLRVARELEAKLSSEPDVDIALDYWGGLRLMERMVGYDRAIIVDAIRTDQSSGTIHLLSPEDIPTQRSASAHDVNLATALEFGRQAGAELPDNSSIVLIGIEAEDVQTFDEQLSPEVEAAVPTVVQTVLDILSNGQGSL
jgi:hydrogenase maturation protease